MSRKNSPITAPPPVGSSSARRCDRWLRSRANRRLETPRRGGCQASARAREVRARHRRLPDGAAGGDVVGLRPEQLHDGPPLRGPASRSGRPACRRNSGDWLRSPPRSTATSGTYVDVRRPAPRTSSISLAGPVAGEPDDLGASAQADRRRNTPATSRTSRPRVACRARCGAGTRKPDEAEEAALRPRTAVIRLLDRLGHQCPGDDRRARASAAAGDREPHRDRAAEQPGHRRPAQPRQGSPPRRGPAATASATSSARPSAVSGSADQRLRTGLDAPATPRGRTARANAGGSVVPGRRTIDVGADEGRAQSLEQLRRAASGRPPPRRR